MTRNSKEVKWGDCGSREDDSNIAKKATMEAESVRKDGNKVLANKDSEGEPSLFEIKGILHKKTWHISSLH